MKLIFVLAILKVFASFENGVEATANSGIFPTDLLPTPELLPDVANLFKQFADMMKNGLCGIDIANFPTTHDPDEDRTTVHEWIFIVDFKKYLTKHSFICLLDSAR